jgi:hypothetical protein
VHDARGRGRWRGGGGGGGGIEYLEAKTSLKVFLYDLVK